jgi:hypothetical protein
LFLKNAMALVASMIMEIAFSSLAACLSPSQIGSFCAAGQTGVWHFVKLVLSDLTSTGGGTETKTPEPSKTPEPTKAP